MAFLGEILAHGRGGVAANHTRARDMYERAAAKGNVQALNGLGFLHSGEENYTAARDYFMRAADKGDGDAMYNLCTSHVQVHSFGIL